MEGLPSLCGTQDLLHVTGGAKQHVACGLQAEEDPRKSFLQDVLSPKAVQTIGKGACAIEGCLQVQVANEVLGIHLVQVESYTGLTDLLARLMEEGELVPRPLL